MHPFTKHANSHTAHNRAVTCHRSNARHTARLQKLPNAHRCQPPLAETICCFVASRAAPEPTTRHLHTTHANNHAAPNRPIVQTLVVAATSVDPHHNARVPCRRCLAAAVHLPGAARSRTQPTHHNKRHSPFRRLCALLNHTHAAHSTMTSPGCLAFSKLRIPCATQRKTSTQKTKSHSGR